jgi:PAS domain S-box-containing protein
MLEERTRTGKYMGEMTFKQRDGSPILCDLTSSVFLDKNGEPRTTIVFRDITRRRLAEEALAESAEMFRRVVESAPEAILVQTRGLWVYVNPAAMDLLGASSKDQLIGKRVMDIVHPSYRETVRARIHLAKVQKKRVPAGEQRYIALDGTFVDVETSAVPIRYENEDGVLVFVRNITERKRAEEALRKSEARLSLATNRAGMGTADTDWLTGRSVWSESFFRLLGYEPRPDEEVPFEMWWSRIHPEDQERVYEELERERVEHSERMREYRVIRADTNEVVWLSVFGRFLYDENGEAVRLVGIAFDATERKRTEEALRKSHNELGMLIRDLREKSENLEEVNAALRVLLRQREADKKELGESVMANIRNLILPYIEKIKQSPLSSAQMTWMNILESHINEVTSPFGRTLSTQYTNLTCTEIRIATLVRDGMSTAKIAELLSISEKTVCRHRDNIRKKLRLRGGGINLRTHLLSLQ